jgi:hypothetical protein
MVNWFIMPRRSNTIWWGAFEQYRKDARASKWNENVLNSWSERMKAAHEISVAGYVV